MDLFLVLGEPSSAGAAEATFDEKISVIASSSDSVSNVLVRVLRRLLPTASLPSLLELVLALGRFLPLNFSLPLVGEVGFSLTLMGEALSSSDSV